MPAKIVIHIIVVPVVLPQLGVLGVLGGRVPVVLGELLKFIILLVDLVVGLALLGWFIFLRGERGRGDACRDVASSMRGRASVFTPPRGRRGASAIRLCATCVLLYRYKDGYIRSR